MVLFQAVYLESREAAGGGGKKPPAVIFTIEFRQIVKNSLALLKPLLKTGRKECPLTVKWI